MSQSTWVPQFGSDDAALGHGGRGPSANLASETCQLVEKYTGVSAADAAWSQVGTGPHGSPTSSRIRLPCSFMERTWVLP
jgi:hypothetical protein